LSAQTIIIAVLVAGFVAAVVAYGIWLKKGEKEEAEQASKQGK
jgi:hypothetical protein